jgi:hypothetical protein
VEWWTLGGVLNARVTLDDPVIDHGGAKAHPAGDFAELLK